MCSSSAWQGQEKLKVHSAALWLSQHLGSSSQAATWHFGALDCVLYWQSTVPIRSKGVVTLKPAFGQGCSAMPKGTMQGATGLRDEFVWTILFFAAAILTVHGVNAQNSIDASNAVCTKAGWKVTFTVPHPPACLPSAWSTGSYLARTRRSPSVRRANSTLTWPAILMWEHPCISNAFPEIPRGKLNCRASSRVTFVWWLPNSYCSMRGGFLVMLDTS